MPESAVAVEPVSGLVFKHARRTNYDGSPAVCTVTSVSKPRNRVFYKVGEYQYGPPYRCSLEIFPKIVAEVVREPEPKVSDRGPKLSDDECVNLWAKAYLAGMAAGEAARPVPMHVVQRANPFDDNSPIVKQYEPVMDGVCGFAWVKVRPGNSSFARWAKKNGRGHKSYYGGVDLWVRAFNQSLERKSAYANAAAEVLREAGIKAYGQSRMD